ncbi:hypothetical protein ANCCAN_13568 [Ancylostoma caninum]|uniref:Uncharacterized protein n=1 Tax=Ancylostoma caninum TaxID=29170 RepID=A0A368GBW1_ANCCA|nr:hypothetical protein ANCCAN_13568 [Ancylostoma caninum]
MKPGTSLPRNNFSSIARRLLLNGDSRPVSQVPTTSYHVHRTVTHAHERHTCDLCDRLRGITAEMLKAPKVGKHNKSIRCRRGSNIGRKAKATINHVREFFKLLRRELGHFSQETLFNSPRLLTALACGVSLNTVAIASRIFAPPDEHNPNPWGREAILQETILKKFGQEWSVVVRHFVNTVLEEEGNVTVTDLHNRLCYAYADFPMCSTTLYEFLKALGFSRKVDDNEIYILNENKSETVSESECEHDDDDEKCAGTL